MSIITEYDEVKTMNMFREEGREEGYKEGLKEGLKEGRLDRLLQFLGSLVEKGYITIEQAAEEAGMTVEEFLEKMKLA